MRAKILKTLQILTAVTVYLFMACYLAYAISTKAPLFIVWGVALILALGFVLKLIEILRKKKFIWPPLGNSCTSIFMFLFNAYMFIYRPYQKEECQNSFGLQFNKERKKYGVPTIPGDWKKQNYSAEWYKSGDSTGHYSKYAGIDRQGCKIEFERDDYKLPHSDSSRSLSVLTKYRKSTKPDSIIFTYYFGNSVKTVTRHFADSLLMADHIQKDF